MIVWFLTIGDAGRLAESSRPRASWPALNPRACVAVSSAPTHLHGFVVLGSVVLCITGGEALYADLGHFGRRAIQVSWMGLAYPALFSTTSASAPS